MRAKSEIREALENSLNDDIWKKLRNSLLGRELLAFGAEVISENENVKDTMLMQLNPDTADKNGLNMLSQMNEIPITNVKPSCVVVNMDDDSRTFAPYELQYSVGNVHFTNIEYTMHGKTVSLINGTQKCYAKDLPVSSGARVDGTETYFYDGASSYYGVRLGNAYPDSIVVYDENDLEIQRYSSDVALSNVIGVMCKVVTGVDGDIFVRFVCGEDYEAPSKFKIDWLDHSAMEFDIEDYDVRYDNTKVGTISYFSQGVVDDLDFMRLQLKKEMAKYNGFNTPMSIERYVKGMPYVLDAKCAKDESGINVYIKPSSLNPSLQTYLDFSEVAAHISLNSVLFPSVKVRTGKSIMFGVEISGVNDAKLQMGIKSLIQERFSYENMTFNTVINTGNILSEIYARYGVTPTISMTVREDFVQDKPLSFKPVKNTLKLYDNDNGVTAWEENGVLFGRTNKVNNIPFDKYTMVGSMGTMFILMLKGTPTAETVTTGRYASEDTEEYDTHSTKITYDDYSKKFNKLYLYDVSTNTIKPFDSTMQGLFFQDKQTNLKLSAWNSDEMVLGNLYDIKLLSTNNALALLVIYRNAGTLLDEDGNFEYWNVDNMVQYEEYLTGAYVANSKESEYSGKYQTVFFVKTPFALQNTNIDNWKLFEDCSHGDEEKTAGFYTGLRNIKSDGTLLGVKANWFVYNNKSYYAYEITDTFVNITNGVKNLAVRLNGSFLGMIPYEGDLYVFNEKYVTRITNFDGLKEKEEIYQIYKDINTPMTITEIVREFDNEILFKTADADFYTATGMTAFAGNKMGFANLKAVEDEVTGEKPPQDCKIGGVTADYATFYKEVIQDEGNGYDYYCYDIKNKRLKLYSKTAETSSSSEKIVYPTTYETRTYNLAAFQSQNYARIIAQNSAFMWKQPFEWNLSNQGTGMASEADFDNVYLVKWDNKSQLYKLKQINGSWYLITLTCDGSRLGAGSDSREWSHDELETKISTRHPAGFYKQAWYAFMTALETPESQGGFKPSGASTSMIPNGTRTTSRELSQFTYTKEMTGSDIVDLAEDNKQRPYSILNRAVGYTYALSKAFSTTKGSPTSLSSTYDVYEYIDTWMEQCLNWNGNDLELRYYDRASQSDKTIKITNSNREMFLDYNGNIVVDGDMNNRLKQKLNGGSSNISISRLMVKIQYKTDVTDVIKTVNFSSAVETQEVVNIGYYDEAKNSCVNDTGSEIAYVKYHTQNPNISGDSYLVLDESEIKFV